MRRVLIALVIMCVAGGAAVASGYYSSPSHDEGKGRMIRGMAFSINGQPAENGDIVAAFDESGTLKGHCVVGEGGHFSAGREISKSGTKDLPLGMESITGYIMIQAENLDEAEKLASTNPYIASIRVYEIMSK